MSLRTKLFCLFMSVSTLIILTIYAVNRSQFEQGFKEVKRQHEWRYTRMLIERAEALYDVDRSWLNVQSNPPRWQHWLERRMPHHRADALAHHHDEHRDDANRRLGPPPFINPNRMPPAPPNEMMIERAEMLPITQSWLLSVQKNVIAGPLPYPAVTQLQTHPLYDQQRQLVGYLGINLHNNALLASETVFEKKMLMHLGVNGLFALIGSVLLSFGLASWLVRRLARLRAGAQILRDGDYAFRLDAGSSDEIGDLARDFNALAEHLARLQKYREHSFAEFAHELRTPIAVLRAEIEALQTGVRQCSAAALQSLAAEVVHLMRLVDDLNLLKRADVATLSVHREQGDVVTLIHETAAAHQLQMQAQKIQWQLFAPPQLNAMFDRARLKQVLHNLFENTVRYCERAAQVQIHLSDEEKFWRLRWEDSGPGVAESDLPYLFDRFYRADARLANEGSGLGLAIVRALVHAHSGRLHAEKSSLGGLAIVIEIPHDDTHSSR